ncbi:MAG: aminopeptidase N [Dehalococcoidia bacterium]|jgi:aminopeptidase N|nr:aminopeptidase N [Dehalococcoidia bacterium]
MTAPVPARDVLTRDEAKARDARVSHVSYEIDLSLAAGADSYRGSVTIRFQLTGRDDILLDARIGNIERIELNGEEIETVLEGYRLRLPAAALGTHNTVIAVYSNEFDHGGDGFHKFVDPEDGEEYLYTNLEPYATHRLFPCFDQPDIKAEYTLRVAAPEGWELIANGRESSVERLDDGRIRHAFETTAPFSTYLFALIAGPYHAFREQHGEIPIGFFCRRSLVKHVDIDEIWELTKQGLDFFSSFFDYAYPFVKYDQIAVPEFNAGAMENVGAVTHNEFIIYRDPPTETQRATRADVILHEMAHMWFGNLVTMRWWNDLWLNESFAEYMAHLATYEATKFKTAWQAFNRRKAWAYRQDQLVTTHPIAGEVEDTDQTFLNFDGITYAKGASAIKQLVAVLGMDEFREAMQRYFRRHAFGNTRLSEFVEALQLGTERDLDRWTELWLETPSLNTIAADWEQDGERVSAMRLTQTAPAEYPTIRPHHMDVALGREENGALVIDTLPAEIDGLEADIPDAVGRPAPAIVVPNHNDHDFVKIALDGATLDYLRDNLERVDDALLRQIIWQSLWNMVRDRQLKSTDYIDLAAAKITTETDLELIESVLMNVQASIARYLPDRLREESAHRFFELAWQALNDAPAGDLQIVWGRTLVGLAVNVDDIALCARLADGDLSVPGFTVDQNMRWDIALRHVGYGIDGAQARLDAEQKRDPSDRGQRALRRAEVSVPDADVKAAAWRRFTQDGQDSYGSLHLTAAAMSGFHWWAQRDLLQPFVEPFFDQLPRIFEEHDNEFASTFFGALYPSYRAEQDTLDRASRVLAASGDALPMLARTLREANDELARAIACRALIDG